MNTRVISESAKTKIAEEWAAILAQYPEVSEAVLPREINTFMQEPRGEAGKRPVPLSKPFDWKEMIESLMKETSDKDDLSESENDEASDAADFLNEAARDGQILVELGAEADYLNQVVQCGIIRFLAELPWQNRVALVTGLIRHHCEMLDLRMQWDIFIAARFEMMSNFHRRDAREAKVLKEMLQNHRASFIQFSRMPVDEIDFASFEEMAEKIDLQLIALEEQMEAVNAENVFEGPMTKRLKELQAEGAVSKFDAFFKDLVAKAQEIKKQKQSPK